MENYKSKTGISLIIAEKEDGTYDVNVGSTAGLPQHGLPLMFYSGILKAVSDYVRSVNENVANDSYDDKLMQAFRNTSRAARDLFNREPMATNDKMLEVIKKIVLARKASRKAFNQIAALEYEQDVKKLTDELVALYEEHESQNKQHEK